MTSLADIRKLLGYKQTEFYEQMSQLGYITRNGETDHWEATKLGARDRLVPTPLPR